MGASSSKRPLTAAHKKAFAAFTEEDVAAMEVQFSQAMGAPTARVDNVHNLLVRSSPVSQPHTRPC